jgi:hypothetical protein
MLHYTALLALQALGWAAMLHYTALLAQTLGWAAMLLCSAVGTAGPGLGGNAALHRCWHYRPWVGRQCCTTALALQALGWAAMLHYTALLALQALGGWHAALHPSYEPSGPQHISAVLKELFQPSLFQIDKEERLDLEWGLSQHD